MELKGICSKNKKPNKIGVKLMIYFYLKSLILIIQLNVTVILHFKFDS